MSNLIAPIKSQSPTKNRSTGQAPPIHHESKVHQLVKYHPFNKLVKYHQSKVQKKKN